MSRDSDQRNRLFDVFTLSPLVQLLFGSGNRGNNTFHRGFVVGNGSFSFRLLTAVIHKHAVVGSFHGGERRKASSDQAETLNRTPLLSVMRNHLLDVGRSELENGGDGTGQEHEKIKLSTFHIFL